jgi:hypothetical protein
MNASRNTKIGVLAVTAVALVAVGGAFAAGKLHGSKAAAASGLSPGSYVGSHAGRTAQGWRGRGGGGGMGFGGGGDLAAAATYLGLSQSDLQTDLQSGKTLAQVANATSDTSAAGLIDALVAAEQTKLAAAVSAGTLTQAQADQITKTLQAAVTSLVNGTRPARGGFGGHGGPGGFGGPGGPPPPSGSTPQPGSGTHI